MTVVTKKLAIFLLLVVSVAWAKTDTEPQKVDDAVTKVPVMVETGPIPELQDTKNSECGLLSAFDSSEWRRAGLILAAGTGWLAGAGIEYGNDLHKAKLQREREKLYLFQDDVDQVHFDFGSDHKSQAVTLLKRRKFERLVERLPKELPRDEDRGGFFLSVSGVRFERGADDDTLKVIIKTSMGELTSKGSVSRVGFEEGKTLSPEFYLSGDSSKWSSDESEPVSQWALNAGARFKYDMESKTVRMEGFGVEISWDHPVLGKFNSPRAGLFRLGGTLQ